MSKMKKCNKCEETKDYYEDFYPRVAASGNKVAISICKVCSLNYNKDRQRKAHAALRLLEQQGGI